MQQNVTKCFGCLTCFFWLLCATENLAQNPSLYNFNIAQGLPSNEVYSVYQDKQGFIWFATDNGVARFDGNDLETFNTFDGLIDPVVFGFFEDKEGKIWFRSYSGNLSWFKDNKISAYPHNDRLSRLVSDDLLNSIYPEGNSLWFSTGLVIGKIEESKDSIIDIAEVAKFHCRTVGDRFLIGEKGITQNIRTIKINGLDYPITLSDTSYHHKPITATRWNNNIYFSVNNDLFKFNGTSLKKIYTARAPIVHVSVDKGNSMWIGYKKNGTQRFSDDNFKDPYEISELKEHSVTGVLQDNEGGIWLTTLENGVYHFSNLNVQFFSTNLNGKVTAVYSSRGEILTGHENGTLCFYDVERKKITTNQLIPGGSVVSIFRDANKKIWVSTNSTFILDSADLKPLKTYRIRSNKFAVGKNSIWAVGGVRISKYSMQGDTLSSKLTSVLQRSVFIDDSVIYVTKRLGVLIYDPPSTLHRPYPLLEKYKVTHISPLNDSVLLVTTIGNGLLLINKRTQDVTQFYSHNNFVIDNIYSCVITGEAAWLGTEKGVIMVEKESLANGRVTFKQLTEKGGLKNNKINFLAVSEKEVWAFSDEGFTTIPISLFKTNARPPTFYLRKVIVNDKVLAYDKETQFPYNQNNIELSIGYIGFNNQTVTCRYKLFANDTWKYTTGRSIQLSSLSFGKYAIQLEYSTDNADWIDSRLDFQFSILPPLWARWDFIAGLLAILLAVGYFILRRNEQQKTERLAEFYSNQQNLLNIEMNTLEKERGRISKDLHDGVGSNLVVLKMKIHRFISSYSREFAHEVEQQFQDAISEIRRILYELTPPGLEKYGLLSSLAPYIEKIRQDTKLDIEFYATGDEYQETRKNTLVFRVIQELISNTVKHSNASKITLHVNSFDSELNIIYQDNGTGFNVEDKKDGHGLHNIEARIKALEGNFQVDSGNFGVSFIISIPVNKEV
jgi:signal transduction histidine kinase/ligand-binding sensor domain-containing protein